MWRCGRREKHYKGETDRPASGGEGAARVWDRESWLKLEKAKGGLEVPSGQFPVCEAAGAWEGGVTSSPDPLTGRPLSVINISLTKLFS